VSGNIGKENKNMVISEGWSLQSFLCIVVYGSVGSIFTVTQV